MAVSNYGARHSGESRNLGSRTFPVAMPWPAPLPHIWIPAFAGMTKEEGRSDLVDRDYRSTAML
ncbi:MAG: hypothetical protein OXC83_11670 [Chloroflexi bacterium]|nr:hypothetical protein [Chloroflexota bacterium]